MYILYKYIQKNFFLYINYLWCKTQKIFIIQNINYVEKKWHLLVDEPMEFTKLFSKNLRDNCQLGVYLKGIFLIFQGI